MEGLNDGFKTVGELVWNPFMPSIIAFSVIMAMNSSGEDEMPRSISLAIKIGRYVNRI